MRVAIVHDWLVTYAGAERVLAELIEMFPDADLFSVIDFLADEDRSRLGGKRATTTFIQSLPGAASRYRNYLPLMPLAIEQLDLSGYDLVISSSHAVAKGVLTGPDQLHVSYVHSPIRYAWDMQHQYLRESGLTRGMKSWLIRWLLHRMRVWDARTAAGVDRFVCNSAFIGRRVAKVYGRTSSVVYPPVDIDRFDMVEAKEDFYFTASRLVPYKQVGLIAEAFARMPDRKLVVVGDGPEAPKVRKVAGNNVQYLGYQPDAVLRDLMSRARAFVFAAEEDFGIIPVEAQACGTPVIAYGKGGSLETVIGEGDAATGVFFHEQSVDAICEAVERFERNRFSAAACRANSERFSARRFREEMAGVIDASLAERSVR
ncbi:glycosyltransferase family 4 protein [Lysobacter arvi]|uniref:Glycosyltransferase family 4 protein n=1 Tax=Lysobacter arvi TaxID=3038776 RepID=A0ABU1CAA0_9GAMM|nr:glycosyltransferase family 4 protein [Lysobacter arvi]MDR0181667.1 glycosyltransferase family 4 protein [Lysobacter arvi]